MMAIRQMHPSPSGATQLDASAGLGWQRVLLCLASLLLLAGIWGPALLNSQEIQPELAWPYVAIVGALAFFATWSHRSNRILAAASWLLAALACVKAVPSLAGWAACAGKDSQQFTAESLVPQTKAAVPWAQASRWMRFEGGIAAQDALEEYQVENGERPNQNRKAEVVVARLERSSLSPVPLMLVRISAAARDEPNSQWICGPVTVPDQKFVAALAPASQRPDTLDALLVDALATQEIPLGLLALAGLAWLAGVFLLLSTTAPQKLQSPTSALFRP